MAVKKVPRPAAPTGSPKKSHTLDAKANAKRNAIKAAQRKRTLKVVAAAKPKPANMRKAEKVVAPPTGVRMSKAEGVRVSLPTGGTKIEPPIARATKPKRDPYALPEMPELPSLDSLRLTTLNIIDPIEEAKSEVLVFGEPLTLSPIDDDLDDNEELTNEERENERMAQVHEGFRSRAKKEAERFALATDSEYWLCVVFQDRAQKDQFLRGLDAEQFGDKYIDGTRLAAHLGIHVDKSEIAYNIGGADPKLAVLVDLDPDYGKATKTSRPRSRKTP